jgi:hypothetical protein
MNSKQFIWVGLFVGSTIGSLVPLLWGADIFSFSSIIFSAIGAILGIWVCYRLTQ